MDKIDYYNNVYDDELVMIECPDIKIVNFTSGCSLFSIEGDLIG